MCLYGRRLTPVDSVAYSGLSLGCQSVAKKDFISKNDIRISLKCELGPVALTQGVAAPPGWLLALLPHIRSVHLDTLRMCQLRTALPPIPGAT